MQAIRQRDWGQDTKCIRFGHWSEPILLWFRSCNSLKVWDKNTLRFLTQLLWAALRFWSNESNLDWSRSLHRWIHIKQADSLTVNVQNVVEYHQSAAVFSFYSKCSWWSNSTHLMPIVTGWTLQVTMPTWWVIRDEDTSSIIQYIIISLMWLCSLDVSTD